MVCVLRGEYNLAACSLGLRFPGKPTYNLVVVGCAETFVPKKKTKYVYKSLVVRLTATGTGFLAVGVRT